MQVIKNAEDYRLLQMQMTTRFVKIECKTCKRISGNPLHVRDKYCPDCDKHHKG